MPMRPALWRPGQPPDGTSTINWGHPLTRNLLWCVAPSEGVLREIVRGTTGTLFGAATWNGTTKIGAGVKSPGASTDGLYFKQDDGHVSANLGQNHTVLVWAYATSYPNSGVNTLLEIPRDAANANLGMAIRQDQLHGGVAAYAYFDGSFTRVCQGGSWTFANQLHAYGASRTGGSVGFYKDGTLLTTQAITNGTPTFTGSPHIVLLNRNDGNTGDQLAGTVVFAAIWNRALSTAEMVTLAGDPYQFLAVPNDPVRDVWLMGRSGGTNQSLSQSSSATAATLSASLLTATQTFSKSSSATASSTNYLSASWLLSQSSSALASSVANLAGTHFFTAASQAIASTIQKLLSVGQFLKPHPLGHYLSGYDRAGDGAGGRRGHTANSLTIQATILPPGSASLVINCQVEPLGGTGLLITCAIQSPYTQFAINGNTSVPAPHHLIYQFAPTVGYDMDGLSIKQGYMTIIWQYDWLADEQIAVLMGLYDPQNPEVTATYPNEMGFWVTKQAMMQPPNLGTRSTVIHENVELVFSHIIPD